MTFNKKSTLTKKSKRRGGNFLRKVKNTLKHRKNHRSSNRFDYLSNVSNMIQIIQDRVNNEGISGDIIYDILILAQTMDEDCRDDVIKSQVVQYKGTNTDDFKTDLLHAHDNNILVFYNLYNRPGGVFNRKKMRLLSKMKHKKTIKHYHDKCSLTVNDVFSQLVDRIVIPALRSLHKKKQFNGKPIKLEDVVVTQWQYENLGSIIKLLKQHDSGKFSHLLDYIIPNSQPKQENRNMNRNKNTMLKENGPSVNGTDPEYPLLDLNFNNNGKSNNSNYTRKNVFDPFEGPALVPNIVHSKNIRKSRSRQKTKTNGNNILNNTAPFLTTFNSVEKKQKKYKYNSSKLRSPSMQSMRDNKGIPNAR